MSARVRWAMLAGIVVVALATAAVFGVSAYLRYSAARDRPSEVPTRVTTSAFSGPRIEFRNTAAGQGYGLVASVPLSNPRGARSLSRVACDRIYATTTRTMCLRTDAGVVTTWSAIEYGPGWKKQASWPLPGVPSRTRISLDSRLVSTTAFVTGESYATIGFSTQTVIRSSAGRDYGTLEDFDFRIGGARITAPDRNFWGVTFGGDDRTFYATGATGGTTYLVRGDLRSRTLVSLRTNVECPSLSPDGTRIAFKKNISTGTTPFWSIAVYDLATGGETVLPEKRSVDDQIEWLDSSTLLYGMPRAGAVGDSDVWSIPADASASGSVLLEHAWSPSVIRGES